MQTNDNIAGWVSQFPNLIKTITDPFLIDFFKTHQCPLLHERTLAEEWDQIVKNIGPLEPESENLTGD